MPNILGAIIGWREILNGIKTACNCTTYFFLRLSSGRHNTKGGYSAEKMRMLATLLIWQGRIFPLKRRTTLFFVNFRVILSLLVQGCRIIAL